MQAILPEWAQNISQLGPGTELWADSTGRLLGRRINEPNFYGLRVFSPDAFLLFAGEDEVYCSRLARVRVV